MAMVGFQRSVLCDRTVRVPSLADNRTKHPPRELLLLLRSHHHSSSVNGREGDTDDSPISLSLLHSVDGPFALRRCSGLKREKPGTVNLGARIHQFQGLSFILGLCFSSFLIAKRCFYSWQHDN